MVTLMARAYQIPIHIQQVTSPTSGVNNILAFKYLFVETNRIRVHLFYGNHHCLARMSFINEAILLIISAPHHKYNYV